MKEVLKKALVIVLALAMVFVMFACGNNQEEQQQAETIKWKLSVSAAEGTAGVTEFRKFADDVFEKTGGRLQIDVFPGNALGAEADILANLQTGEVAMAHQSFSLLTQYNEDFNVMDLPFIFDSKEHLARFMETKEAKALTESFHKNGLWVPDIYLLGYRFPQSRDKALATVADFKNIIFRVMDTPVQMGTLEALGATPITVPFNDLYNAIQSKVCDACSLDVNAMFTVSSYEVAKYVTALPLFAVPHGAIISDKAMEALPDDLRPQVEALILEWVPKVMDAMYVDNNVTLLNKLSAEKGCTVTEVTDTAPFVEAVQGVWDEVCAKYSGVQKLLDVINSVR